ncbi:hypothetical protein LTR36_000586 [Oleoguttula mirabilis]|uniref:Quercetin 2,3-dioxygenase n=1 Tax=Oleoguttula mirabilis TaxID=1507867 RepID=A0AAV9JQJ3_9PEZI|nr:hypothetical protein LTR36_000586 [Oleoguttula mirabilis]
MRTSAAITCLAGLSTLAAAATSSLWVDTPPTFVRPYVIGHYANAEATRVGAQIYRFYVTGPSSGGLFTLLGTNSYSSGALGVLPHIHERHHENFFCYKGRFQLWTEKTDVGVNDGRLMTAGDFGTAPINTTHTFQILDPDTEMIGVIVPGGFEDLFFAISDGNVTYPNLTPYPPQTFSDAAGAGSSSSEITALEQFDVYAQLDYTPRRDFVNGTAPANATWHDGPNTIPSVSGTPYFVASNYGPKYINGAYGIWQIVQPFVTAVTGEHDYTEGSITISAQPANATVPTWNLTNHTAFQILEGALSLTMGQETVTLASGDVAFIPGQTEFQYWSEGAFTKFHYVSAGSAGIEKALMAHAGNWSYPAFPTYLA